MENKSQRLTLAISYACLALSMSLVGIYVALSNPLVLGFGVFVLAWLRFAIRAIATLHWRPKPASEPPPSIKIYLLLFTESFFGNFLFSILMLYGMVLSQAFSAGIIISCIPVAVALLSRIFLKERIHRSTQWALLLAV
ncbi:MAG: EamA family transporter [Limnohabitans sp.]|nr:EamA family transporter [Limnohabitans sp.]